MIAPFHTISGAVAPLPLNDVNTDLIIPIDHSILVSREEMGRFAFQPLRYDEEGRKIAGFVFNRPEFHGAPILFTGANFGCGSSREPAAWALRALGIRVIIAPSFGEIFEGNWVRNGGLPITVDEEIHERLKRAALEPEPLRATVDLATRHFSSPALAFDFFIDDARRTVLLEGLDPIEATLLMQGDILAFQERDRRKRPWIWDLADIPVDRSAAEARPHRQGST
jgi:3-isopropylmalate/(R)-2-methylmalate dehydratase small subunit